MGSMNIWVVLPLVVLFWGVGIWGIVKFAARMFAREIG